MTNILKMKMMELGKDESGVAFAFTVTVLLIIFLFGFAIYACGETVRQRIELQNAADAAAYSAALVQADTISRVAVINKAMAWNYVMMTRRQMDHVVDRWLEKVLERWQHDRTLTMIAQTGCACHPRAEFMNWRVGVDPSGGASEAITHQLIRLNESQNAGIPEITASHAGATAQNPQSLLQALRDCIVSMNQAEKELISGMKTRVENAVEFTVNANVSLTENDKKVKDRREIQWALHELKGADVYFEALKSDEKRFLGFGDFSGSAQEVFGTGADTWLPLENADGFQRNYTQTGNTLSARWFTYNQRWGHPDTPHCVYFGPIIHAAAPVTAEEGRDEYYIGEKACPNVLKSNYFQTDGAIIVGVSRPLNNPFAFIFGGGEKSGIYSAFQVGGGTQTMWSVSGARAGYRLSEWREGEYRNRGRIEDKDNLCVADWDAEFLPLREETTAKSNMLEDLAKKIGATRTFVGKDRVGSYSNIEFSGAKSHLHH